MTTKSTTDNGPRTTDKQNWRLRAAAGAAALLLAAATPNTKAATTLYAAADNGTGDVFGTLNLTTGAFNQISTEPTLLYSLTVGPNGTLYAGGSDGNIYTVNTSSGAITRFGTISVPTNGAVPGLSGLAARASGGFYGDYITPDERAELLSITSDGTQYTQIGEGTVGGLTGSGSLVYGPNGNLYETALNDQTGSSLLAVNPANGSTTTVGSGYGATPYLAIATIGSTLYGIDSQNPGTPAIYTINTTTGAATATGVSVTGLPSGYVFDTVTSVNYVAVPEPTSLGLLAIGSAGVLARRRRRTAGAI